MIRLALAVTAANWGTAHDPPKSAPPVNLAMAVLLVRVTADPIVMLGVAGLEADVPLCAERRLEAEEVVEGAVDDERDNELEDEREDAITDKLDGKRKGELEENPEEEPEFEIFDEELLVVEDGQPSETEMLMLTVVQSLVVNAKASGLQLV